MMHLIRRAQFCAKALENALIGEYNTPDWRAQNTLLGTLTCMNVEVGCFDLDKTPAHALADIAAINANLANYEIAFENEEELDEMNYAHCADMISKVNDRMTNLQTEGIKNRWFPSTFSYWEEGRKLEQAYEQELQAKRSASENANA